MREEISEFQFFRISILVSGEVLVSDQKKISTLHPARMTSFAPQVYFTKIAVTLSTLFQCRIFFSDTLCPSTPKAMVTFLYVTAGFAHPHRRAKFAQFRF